MSVCNLLLVPVAAWGLAGQPSAQPNADGARVETGVQSPAARLGARTRANLCVRGVIPDVVIVPDEASYLEAVADWTPQAFFPVLIDDGSMRAREDIARFVRAFKPRNVVRWSADAALPARGDARRAAIHGACARAWDMDADATPEALHAHWAEAGIVPTGIVVCDDSDAGWTGALALAAGRAQPLAWVSIPGHAGRRVGGAMSLEEAGQLSLDIERACEATGFPWETLGDALDAVTVCQAMASRVQGAEGEFLATTDLLGRRRGDPTKRWAWCGQIIGDEARSAYIAMSSLFLDCDRAWLFDGYQNTGAFARWDATAAGRVLQEAGIEAEVIDEPHGGVDMWRREASGPIVADLIFVNTQGNRAFFDLNPGRAFAGDVPMLGHPAMVHFVHSWSAANIGSRRTVGGRWLERGAVGYFGSVQEPYLQAFVPTPTVAARIVDGQVWGAACRLTDGPPWRLALFGDPLSVIGCAQRLEDEAPPLDDVQGVEESMREAVDAGEYVRAVADLAILGRDADAADLLVALANDRPEVLTGEVIAASLPSVFREGRTDDYVRLYAMLPVELAEDGLLQDLLWLSVMWQLDTTQDVWMVNVLRTHLRPEQIAADAIMLAGAVDRLEGRAAAIALLTEARGTADTARERRELDDALGRLRP